MKKKEWANVVLVDEKEGEREIRKEYQDATTGTEILEKDVLAYLVWIPRYRYKLFNVNSVLKGEEKEDGEIMAEQEIEIVFEYNYTIKANGSKDGEWLTHPAFTFGSDELNGYWVGKFETSTGPTLSCHDTASSDNCNNENQIPSIKPKVPSLRHQNLKNQFVTAKKFNNEIEYGITTDYNAHMMKNMEWGAIVHLGHSKYGNSMYTGPNKEIYQNKSSGYVTGSSNGTPSQSRSNPQCDYDVIVDRGNGTGACGAGASTTGNIFGVYDMSGGSWEKVMAGVYTYTTKTSIMLASSGFVDTQLILSNPDFIGIKYIDIYDYGTTEADHTAYSRRKLGDATRETIDWYGDLAPFVKSTAPWFDRGGRSGNDDSAGSFYFYNNSGGNDNRESLRVVISPCK